MLVIRNIPNLIMELVKGYYVCMYRDRTGHVYVIKSKDSKGNEVKLPSSIQTDLPAYCKANKIKPSFVFETRPTSRYWESNEIIGLYDTLNDSQFSVFFDKATKDIIENKIIQAWLLNDVALETSSIEEYNKTLSTYKKDPDSIIGYKLDSFNDGYYVVNGYLIEVRNQQILDQDETPFSTLVDSLDFYFTDDCQPDVIKLKESIARKFQSKKYADILQQGFTPSYSRQHEILKFLRDTLDPLQSSNVVQLSRQVDLKFESLILAETELLNTCSGRLADSGIALDWLPEQIKERSKLAAMERTLQAALDEFGSVDHPVIQKLQKDIADLTTVLSKQALLPGQ